MDFSKGEAVRKRRLTNASCQASDGLQHTSFGGACNRLISRESHTPEKGWERPPASAKKFSDSKLDKGTKSARKETVAEL
jgi:hypothetical protein